MSKVGKTAVLMKVKVSNLEALLRNAHKLKNKDIFSNSMQISTNNYSLEKKTQKNHQNKPSVAMSKTLLSNVANNEK